MSDTSQGPGWWLASDGKWYPPEQWTGPPNTGPPASSFQTGETSTPTQPWEAPQGAPSTGSTPVTGQPGPTWPPASTAPAAEPMVPGQPPAYGANPFPGTAPP